MYIIQAERLFAHPATVELHSRNVKDAVRSLFSNPKFLIALLITLIILVAIAGPLVGYLIYRRRNAKDGSGISLMGSPSLAIEKTSDIEISAPISPPMDSIKTMDRSFKNQQKTLSRLSNGSQKYRQNRRSSMAAREFLKNEEDESYDPQRFSVYSVMPLDDSLEVSPAVSHVDTLRGPIDLRSPYVVQKSYLAQEFDEITVNPGNTIQVLKVYDDGWCLCVSLETNVKGVIPTDCLLL
jgi:hypothetical protein